MLTQTPSPLDASKQPVRVPPPRPSPNEVTRATQSVIDLALKVQKISSDKRRTTG